MGGISRERDLRRNKGHQLAAISGSTNAPEGSKRIIQNQIFLFLNESLFLFFTTQCTRVIHGLVKGRFISVCKLL